METRNIHCKGKNKLHIMLYCIKIPRSKLKPSRQDYILIPVVLLKNV